ncbi:MAG: M23 family metallopeptidase [Bdellovibrionales bacterium]|nr:M23 family metallopeptidase [Bdellovibrionales bacterium]
MSLLKATLLSSALCCFSLFSREVQAESVFVYPLLGERVSSSFGPRNHPVRHVQRHHSGIDLAAPQGAQIRAIASGRVVYADPYKGYGNLVVIEHANGITSHYGHCSKIHVDPGQEVKAGEIIATVGKTGLATGYHLHFEIRINGEPKDPDVYIPGLRDEPLG